jgi:hypothetical protein
MEEMIEKQRRRKLASLPFPEKIKILERLRRVSETAGKSGLRQRNNIEPTPDTQ